MTLVVLLFLMHEFFLARFSVQGLTKSSQSAFCNELEGNSLSVTRKNSAFPETKVRSSGGGEISPCITFVKVQINCYENSYNIWLYTSKWVRRLIYSQSHRTLPSSAEL